MSSRREYCGDDESVRDGRPRPAVDAALEAHHVRRPLGIGEQVQSHAVAHVRALGRDPRVPLQHRRPDGRGAPAAPARVAGVVEHDGAVAHLGPRPQAGDVVEDAVRRVVVGSDRLPAVAAVGLEGDLVERVAADVGADLDALALRRRDGRRVERDRRRAPGPRHAAGQLVDDGRQRRHGDAQLAVGVGAQPGVALAVDAVVAAPARVGRDRGGLRGLAVVERHDVLALGAALHAREGVDAGAFVGVAVLQRAVAERGVPARDRGEPPDRAVQRMADVEVLVRRRGVRPDQVVVVVGGDLAGEHVLARALVATVADEALLVAVVDDGIAAREVHELVRELVALEHLGVVGAGVGLADEHADPPHVVVAEEGRQLVGVRIGVRVPVVVLEEGLQLGRRL